MVHAAPLLVTSAERAIWRGGTCPARGFNRLDKTHKRHDEAMAIVLAVDCSLPFQSAPRASEVFELCRESTLRIHALALETVPEQLVEVVAFGERARLVEPATLPELQYEYLYGSNLAEAFALGRELLVRRPVGGGRRIIVTTYSDPTAHVLPSGDVFFNYPPVAATLDATVAEARACGDDSVTIDILLIADVTRFDVITDACNVTGGHVVDCRTQSPTESALRSLVRL